MKIYSQDLIEAGLPFIDNAIMVHGFEKELIQKLPKEKAFKGLGEIAVEMVDKRGQKFAYGSGPMRSGPRSFAENTIIHDHVLRWIATGDHPYKMPVFYQLVFQVEIHRIREKDYVDRDADFIHDLCRDFSQPILHHPLLQMFVVMPGAIFSTGARQEYQIFRERRDTVRIPVIHAEDHRIPGLKKLMGELAER